MAPVAQPVGTVTLVFTDIEGSTRLLGELGEEQYRKILGDHRDTVRAAFCSRGGYEVDYEGDGFFYAFGSATDAVEAVEETMATLSSGPIRLRVGIHTGEPGLDPPKYVGMDVHKAARIMAAGHGGQVLLSQTTRQLLDQSFDIKALGRHHLKDVPAPQQLFQVGDKAFPPLRTLRRSNLPVPVSGFVGRERELRELGALLRSGARLLTLTGPGGTGKTRLAIQAASEASGEFPDGVWWVPLAPLRDAEFVLTSVAQTLGVAEQPGREIEQTLRDSLAGHQSLVLLDNLEHLLPAAAGAVSFLHESDGPALIVTSRERLRLSGENLYPVAPMSTTDGVRLFLARAATSGHELDDSSSIEELCHELDNLPLAIELAAARVGVLNPAEMLVRLGGRLDRLKGARDADPRQQTLRATIRWSHDLLSVEEQQLFARLAVFAGGCTLEAAEEVCDADLDNIESLLDKSLLRRTANRYWMLETIREYAAECLEASGEADEFRQRHLVFFTAFMDEAAQALRGREQARMLVSLDADIGNLRLALARAHEVGAVEAGLGIGAHLARFWEARGLSAEAVRWLSAFTDASAGSRLARRALALYWRGRFSIWVGDWNAADRQFGEAAALSRETGSDDTRALSLGKNSWVAALLGRPEEGRQLAEEAVATARLLQDDWVLAEVLNDLGATLTTTSDTEEAGLAFTESLLLRRRLGDSQNVIDSLNNIGNLAMYEGRHADAAVLFDECLELSRALGELRQLTLAAANRGQIHLLSGELTAARQLLQENAELCFRCGDRRIGGATLQALAAVEAASKRWRKSGRLWGAGATMHGPSANPDERLLWSPWLADALESLGRREFDAAVAEGKAMTFEEAVAYADERD
jgi:predicted ATPase/class 3 adenylate cyclase